MSSIEPPGAAPKDPKSVWRLVRRMILFLAPAKFEVAVTCLVFIAYIGAEVWAVKSLGPAVNLVNEVVVQKGGAETPSLWAWLHGPEGSLGAQFSHALLWLAVAKVTLSLLAYARTVCNTWQSMSMVFHMRAQVYDRLQRVGFAFHDEHASGQLINRALNDLQAVRQFANFGLHAIIDLTFSLAGYFTLIVLRSPWMGLAVLSVLPFWIWAIRRWARQSRPIYEKQMTASDEVTRLLTEYVAGVHVVRAFATEDQEEVKYRNASQTLLERILAGVGLTMRMNPLVRGIAVTANVGLFGLGAYFVQKGSLSLGDLVVFGAAMGTILGKLHLLNGIADAYQRAVVSSQRLFEILDSPDTTPQIPDAEPLRPGGGEVRFEGVCFSYDPGKPVLEEVSFRIPAGGRVALVGPTGSGKTTVAALLGRFYDPDVGRILVDGEDIRHVTLQSVRDAVGYVFQENYLFSDTVARNIGYADLKAPRHKIQEAARIAHAEEFIEGLPQKYDMLVGEYGATLSGGQRQRLAIARAILHNPRVLVLDDALSAVDAQTEAQIRHELERLTTRRTTFIVTSRVSTARRAELILVLEDGRITQRGTHDELIRQPGFYREVAESQFADVGESEGRADSHLGRMTRAGRTSGRQVNEED